MLVCLTPFFFIINFNPNVVSFFEDLVSSTCTLGLESMTLWSTPFSWGKEFSFEL